MAAELHPTTETLRRIRWIQSLTILWMVVEVVVSLIGAWKARSPSLLAFGGDSGIELLSAVVVLWRFRSSSTKEKTERRAARVAGGLLFLLAAYVAVASVAFLLGRTKASPSIPGIALLAAAGFVMPWLAHQKRKLSAATASGALRADAAQSALCAYMAWIALAGLLLNALWGIRSADPVAALLLTPLVLREAWESAKGNPCACE
jgi:divalent metal cation (Fe/Co/Zn/Cd) transporter